jgi:hypothetical protein
MKSPAIAHATDSAFPPAYFADARQDVGDCLLLSMTMNASPPRPRFNLEQAAPDGRGDTERRRDSSTTFGVRRLRCPRVELSRAGDMDGGRKVHGRPDPWILNEKGSRRLIGRRLNWSLTIRCRMKWKPVESAPSMLSHQMIGNPKLLTRCARGSKRKCSGRPSRS